MTRRIARKPNGKPADNSVLRSIEKSLQVIEGHMAAQVIERADNAARFEQRVKEDDEFRAKVTEKIDKVEDRLAPIEAAVGRNPLIERELWKLVKLRNQAEGAQIFVAKVAKVSGTMWAIVGSAVTAFGLWLWQYWPFK